MCKKLAAQLDMQLRSESSKRGLRRVMQHEAGTARKDLGLDLRDLHASAGPSNRGTTMIREVWADNLEAEMAGIRGLVLKYPYISMDTEFPGVVARPLGVFRSQSEFLYQALRCNVDLLKIIQLGIALSDENGRHPPDCSTWQFNFSFSLDDDTYAQESIDLLTHSGLDFEQHRRRGINVMKFGDLLTSSGLVLVDEVKWISFHSGYDFGYLLKVLTNAPLPAEENEFFELLSIFFPAFYDIKYLMKTCKTLKGGLQDIADDLGLERIGTQHQAGSDALLTAMAFFKILHVFFEDRIDEIDKYVGSLYGITPGTQEKDRSNPFVVGKMDPAVLLGSTPPTML